MRFQGESPYNGERFSAAFVREEAAWHRAEFPDCRVLTVSDGWHDLGDLPDVIVYPAQRDLIQEAGPQDIFLIATENNGLAALAVRDIIKQGNRYYPVRWFHPSAYFHTDFTWRLAAHREYIEQGRIFDTGKWEVGDFDNIAQCISLSRDLPGSYVEIGCFRGNSGGAALAYMQALGLTRQAWFFDVFEGFDYDEAKNSLDAYWFGTHATEGLECVSSRLERFISDRLDVKVRRANIITDDIGCVGPIAVANVDVDLLEAVSAGLEKCAPLIVPGGFMIAEDPGHTPGLVGAQIALEDFMRSPAGRAFTIMYMASGQYVLQKR